MSLIKEKFKSLALNNEKALITYSVAGDPDIDSSEKIIEEFIENGADIIEIGVPFSDPMAEGPVIQLGHERALLNKISIEDILSMSCRIKRKYINTPLVLMGYMNNFLSLGDELFSKLKDNGIDGLIIVDLPYEESSVFLKKLNKENIDLIRLISPTTTQERIIKIISTSSGYLYYISLKGVTGSNISISSDLDERIKNIKEQTELPIVVGFGIKDSDTANKMASISDGVVVGSKLVDEISKLENSDEIRSNDNLKSIIKDLKCGINNYG